MKYEFFFRNSKIGKNIVIYGIKIGKRVVLTLCNYVVELHNRNGIVLDNINGNMIK